MRKILTWLMLLCLFNVQAHAQIISGAASGGSTSIRTGTPVTNPEVIQDGDSKTPEVINAMQWIRARYGVDFTIPYPNGFGIGGSTSANTGTCTSNGQGWFSAPCNLTNPTRMAATLAAIQSRVALGKPVDLSLRFFTNDSSVTPDVSMANLKIYYNTVFRPSGARYLLLWAVEANNSASAVNNATQVALNRMMAQFARENPDVKFGDYTSSVLDPDPANSFGRQIPYTFTANTGAPLGSVMRDNLHHSGYGDYKSQFGITDLVRKLYAARPKLSLSSADAYNASSPAVFNGNMLGAAARTVALGGTTAINTAACAGTGCSVTGTGPLNLYTSGTLSGSMTVTFTTRQITIAQDDLTWPRGTWTVVNMAFGGTPSADTTISIINFSTNIAAHPIAIGDKMVQGALLWANNVNGIYQLSMRQSGGVEQVLIYGLNNFSISPLADAIVNLDGPLEMGGDPYTIIGSGGSGYTTVQNGVSFAFRGTVPASGSIDIGLIYEAPYAP